MKTITLSNYPRSTLLGAATAALLLGARPVSADDPHNDQLGSIIVIAMENHNFTQPNPTASPQQILGNPAAPYLNSLITPGNPHAAAVSYATTYHNAGVGVHPSEPNYVWAEAGTDFGVHTDADPSAANHNIFSADHFTRQLDTAGIGWKNYQEDVQLSAAPTISASGSNGPVNPYYGTTQFNYAVKHNPMAFFDDTATVNVYPLAQFFQDLGNNALARYTWITPNQFNDAHSILSGGYTYQGTHFTGDQAAIAQGDNFLSQVVPQIMASGAYQNNGAIVIWWDETERGDDPARTIPEIVISPLAKGNAFASSVELNHSSDIKTWEELLGLPFLNNPIPTAETAASGRGYDNVAVVNDLSDLFVPGVIPGPRGFDVTNEPAILNPHTQHVSQVVHISNNGTSAVPGPIFLVLDNLPSGASLVNADGNTTVLAPLGSPFISIRLGGSSDGNSDANGSDVLHPHQTKTVKLDMLIPNGADLSYTPRVLTVTPAP